MRTFITAVMLLMFFSAGWAQEPLPVPVGPQEGAMAISQVQKLAPPDAGQFGYSMDANGNSEGSILVVGAPHTTVNNVFSAGAIFIYQMDSAGQWQFGQRIASPVPNGFQGFGSSVSVGGSGSETRIAVGAPQENYQGDRDGRVYIFRLEGEIWLQEAALHNSSQPLGYHPRYFGQAVSLSEDGIHLAVGEPLRGNDTSGQNPGYVHVYTRSGTQWSITILLSPPDNTGSFGAAVKLIVNGSDALLAIGSGGKGLYLFHRPDGIWKPQQKIIAGYGHEFAISGPPEQRIIAIKGGDTLEGGIYIFRHNGTEWFNSAFLHPSQFLIPMPYMQRFGDQIELVGSASDTTLYTTISTSWSPSDRLILRINLTPGAATLLEAISSPEPNRIQTADELLVPPGTVGETLISGATSAGNGTVHIFGSKPGVQTTPEALAIIEGRSGARYSIFVATMPTADVIITADPAEGCDIGAGEGQPITLVFTPANWSSVQHLTVQAVQDNVAEAAVDCPITHSAASSDPNYEGILISTVHVTVIDAPSESVNITLSGHQSIAVTEGGAIESYNIKLASKPTAPVQVYVMPDAQCNVGAGNGKPKAFNIDPILRGTAVTVAAADDALNEGTHHCNILHSVSGATEYAGMAVPNVNVTITDNDAANLIANGDFETAANAPWVIKNKTGDKVLCDTATRRAAFAGSCAFKFKGGVSESASLTQNVDLTGVVFGESDALRLQAMVNGGAAAKGKLRLRVVYAGGEDTVVKLAMPTTGVYALTESAWLLLESPDVQAITVTIQHKSAKGSVWVDNVALWHRPVIVLRGVPAAAVDADGFRAP